VPMLPGHHHGGGSKGLSMTSGTRATGKPPPRPANKLVNVSAVSASAAQQTANQSAHAKSPPKTK